jgi:hypothetical protein
VGVSVSDRKIKIKPPNRTRFRQASPTLPFHSCNYLAGACCHVRWVQRVPARDHAGGEKVGRCRPSTDVYAHFNPVVHCILQRQGSLVVTNDHPLQCRQTPTHQFDATAPCLAMSRSACVIGVQPPRRWSMSSVRNSTMLGVPDFAAGSGGC